MSDSSCEVVICFPLTSTLLHALNHCREAICRAGLNVHSSLAVSLRVDCGHQLLQKCFRFFEILRGWDVGFREVKRKYVSAPEYLVYQRLLSSTSINHRDMMIAPHIIIMVQERSLRL